jgi:hypothetical protein
MSLNKKQRVAIALASIQSAHSGGVRAYLDRNPDAYEHAPEMIAAIKAKQIDLSGDPYDVAATAHAFVKRTSGKGLFTQPGKLEAGMREIFDRLK